MACINAVIGTPRGPLDAGVRPGRPGARLDRDVLRPSTRSESGRRGIGRHGDPPGSDSPGTSSGGRKPAPAIDRDAALISLSRRLLQRDGVDSVMHEVLLAAAELLHVNKGSVQLWDGSAQGLRLVSTIGFDREFAERFQFVETDGFTTCAAALRQRERVVVEDFAGDPAFSRL